MINKDQLLTHPKVSVVESVVEPRLEKVGVAVAVLEGVVDVVGHPLPVRDWSAPGNMLILNVFI